MIRMIWGGVLGMGALGMRHYEGAAGAERLVSLACADGDVCDFSGERGAERQVQRRNEATGYYWNTATSTIDGTIQRTPLFEAPQSLGLGLNRSTSIARPRVE